MQSYLQLPKHPLHNLADRCRSTLLARHEGIEVVSHVVPSLTGASAAVKDFPEEKGRKDIIFEVRNAGINHRARVITGFEVEVRGRKLEGDQFRHLKLDQTTHIAFNQIGFFNAVSKFEAYDVAVPVCPVMMDAGGIACAPFLTAQFNAVVGGYKRLTTTAATFGPGPLQIWHCSCTIETDGKSSYLYLPLFHHRLNDNGRPSLPDRVWTGARVLLALIKC